MASDPRRVKGPAGKKKTAKDPNGPVGRTRGNVAAKVASTRTPGKATAGAGKVPTQSWNASQKSRTVKQAGAKAQTKRPARSVRSSGGTR
jgi:hypothetical protein